MKHANLLITGCGGAFIKDTLESIRAMAVERMYDIRITGAASEPDFSLLYILNDYIKVKRSNEDGYLDELINICKEKNIDILIPTVGSELMLLAENVHRFEEIGTKVSVSNPNSIACTTDKEMFVELCGRAGVKVPSTLVATNVSVLEQAAEALGYPNERVVVKLKDQEGSRGFRILAPDKELAEDFLRNKPKTNLTSLGNMVKIFDNLEHPEVLVQEYIVGTEYSTDCLCQNGEILCMTGRINSVVDSSIPMESTSTKYDKAFEYSKAIVREAGLDGNVGIDFFIRHDGDVVALECNPRVTATIGLSTHAGINLIGMQIMRMLGEPINEMHDFKTVTMERKLTTLFRDERGYISE